MANYTAYTSLAMAAENAFKDIHYGGPGGPDWSKLPPSEVPDINGLPRTFGNDMVAPAIEIQRRLLRDRPIPHGHFLSYGLTDLYGRSVAVQDAVRFDTEYPSGFGVELSLRIKLPDDVAPREWFPAWAIEILREQIAYIREAGKPLWHGHWIRVANNPSVAGFACVFDPSFDVIRSISGRIDIIQLVLLTADEVELCEKQLTSRFLLQLMGETNRDFVSVIGRPSILASPAMRERALQLEELGL